MSVAAVAKETTIHASVMQLVEAKERHRFDQRCSTQMIEDAKINTAVLFMVHHAAY